MTTVLTSPAVEPAHAPASRTFDGVICFGGVDWWYHNRGHYDLQMMRECSALMPVLFVNSIGMRFPRVGKGGMFLKRIRRKLKSMRRGAVSVRENFTVYSPLSIPGRRAAALSARLLPLQVGRVARELGITRPLVWVACPPAADAAAALDPAAMIYQRTDRFEAFHGVDVEQIKGFDRRLKEGADLTLFCSSLLLDEEGAACRRAAFIDHGVDYDRFAQAGTAPTAEPADVAALPRPRVGFVGGIDAHTFDPELFVAAAALVPQATFVLVGACSLPEGWCTLPNVVMLGQKPYDEVARYMAACDVLIMPWNKSPWIAACNPVKLKEYLAVGRPVVSTPFYELERYRDVVAVADTAEGFAAAIGDALAMPGDAKPRRTRVESATWTARFARVLDELKEVGVERDARA